MFINKIFKLILRFKLASLRNTNPILINRIVVGFICSHNEIFPVIIRCIFLWRIFFILEALFYLQIPKNNVPKIKVCVSTVLFSVEHEYFKHTKFVPSFLFFFFWCVLYPYFLSYPFSKGFDRARNACYDIFTRIFYVT